MKPLSILEDVSFGFGNRMPVLIQSEAAECGLACLAMVAGFYGYRTDLPSLRRRCAVSLKGMTLAHMTQIAGELQLGARPVKLQLNDLGNLKVPCILHWEMNHFVVLTEVGRGSITIHDPARGRCRITRAAASAAFTGAALELWPASNFAPRREERAVTIRSLLGKVTGLYQAALQILMLAFALEVFTILSPLFLQWVIDNVIVAADQHLLTTLVVGFSLLLLVQTAVSTVRSLALMHLSTSLNVRWRANVFAHLLRLPVQFFEKRHLGDVTSRFASIEQIERTLTTSFAAAILDGVMAVVTLAVMFAYSKVLAWLAVGAVVAYLLCRYGWYAALFAATRSEIVLAAKQQTHFLESVRGIKAIKLFRREDPRRATWLTMLVDEINARLRTQRLQVVYESIKGLVSGAAMVLTVWWGAKLILRGEFSVGALVAFMAYRGQFDARMARLIDNLFEFRLLRLHAERLADIVLEPSESEHAHAAPADNGEFDSSIAVSNLYFRYAAHEPYVLQGVSFTIADGESVAIVGPSGCGKTTLLNLILGIYPPSSGDIQVGGASIKSFGVHALRGAVGTVTQDDVLFAGSIADNISFFDPAMDREWLEECARLAAIHDDIRTMPMGYNSLVGDMGTSLSGGQKQRVLLARALYKKPRILILDEATSHLDLACEQQVGAAIAEMKLTRLIVAHRPETVAGATRVITMSDGKVVSDSAQATRRLAGSKDHRAEIPRAPSALSVEAHTTSCT